MFWANQRGPDSKLYAICDDHGRLRVMLLTEGQMSDCKGVALMFEAMPAAPVLFAERGYDADWFRQALAARGTAACMPSRKGRKTPIPHDPVLYRRRHRINNMFGRLKSLPRRRPGTGDVFTPATTDALTPLCPLSIAAFVIFWINQ